MVTLDRFNQIDYSLQCGRLRALADVFRPKQIIAEQNSIGQVVIEQLLRDGLRIEPFLTTNASKTQAIESLALAFERGDIRILDDRVLINELVAYQAERLPSGLLRYGAPSGQHDDCVMALAIAWNAVTGFSRPVYAVPESEIVVQPFAIPDAWPCAFGVDTSPYCTAVVCGMVDPQTDTFYLNEEYLGHDSDPLVHAREIRKRGAWIPGVMDPSGNGGSQADGWTDRNLSKGRSGSPGCGNSGPVRADRGIQANEHGAI